MFGLESANDRPLLLSTRVGKASAFKFLTVSHAHSGFRKKPKVWHLITPEACNTREFHRPGEKEPLASDF